MGAGATVGAASTWATIAYIAQAAAAAASIANMGYQASQGGPELPNPGKTSAEVARAQALLLPYQRGLAAAEQQGTKFDSGATQQTMTRDELLKLRHELRDQRHKTRDKTTKIQEQFIKDILHGKPSKKSDNPYDNRGDEFTVYRRPDGSLVPENLATADFTGFGTADIESQLARQAADMQIALGAKYGEDFARQQAELARLADPEGTQARDLEYEMIQNEMAKPHPVNPLSLQLDKDIDEQVKAGAGFSDMDRRALDAAVAGAAGARGGGSGVDTNAAAEHLSTGMEGAARRQSAIGKGLSWLSSGQTPEDITYRRTQQNLANLGAFVGGRTPEDQFGDLARAGKGAAPLYGGQPLPGQPNNAGAAGGPFSIAAWQQQMKNNAGQSNNWFAGLSALLSGLGAAGSAKG